MMMMLSFYVGGVNNSIRVYDGDEADVGGYGVGYDVGDDDGR